ncbi:uncharacterized protein EURHEDRAFT_390169, partial [Aspergillus ruber CBS 135680]
AHPRQAYPREAYPREAYPEKPTHEKPAGPKPSSLTIKGSKPTTSKPLIHSTIPVYVPTASSTASTFATPSKGGDDKEGKGNENGVYPTATGDEFKSLGGKVSASGLGVVVGGIVGLLGFFY